MNNYSRDKYIQLISCSEPSSDMDNSDLSTKLAQVKMEIEAIDAEIEQLNNDLASCKTDIESIENDIITATEERKKNDEYIEQGTTDMEKEIVFPKEVEADLNKMAYFNEPALKKELSDNIEKLEEIIKKRVTKIEKRHDEYEDVLSDPGERKIRRSIDEEK